MKVGTHIYLPPPFYSLVFSPLLYSIPMSEGFGLIAIMSGVDKQLGPVVWCKFKLVVKLPTSAVSDVID